MKIIKSIILIFAIFFCMSFLCSCGTKEVVGPQGEQGIQGDMGPQGPQGEPGKDGHSPVINIGENGNWFIDGVDTDVSAKGEQGVSIVCTSYDENGNLVITYSNGTTQVVEHMWQKYYTLEEADCQIDGKELQFCKNCGLVRLLTIPRTGHNAGEWIIDYEPTCTLEGSKHQICATCGETIKIESIPAVGHSYTSSVIEPTCTSYGYNLHTCSVCGDSYKDDFVDTNDGHNFRKFDTCEYCELNINDVAIDFYTMSATESDNVKGYVVNRTDGNYDFYVKGNGAIKDYGNGSPIILDGYSFVNVYIDNNVTSIGNGAFAGCTSLTSIEIGESVTSIGNGAFAGCTSLISVFIPSNVTIIEESAFFGCTSLTSVIISNSVTSIGNRAFERCTSLISVFIPSNVTSIGYDAFRDCTSVTIYCEVESSPNGWSTIAFGGGISTPCVVVWGNDTSIIIDGIQYIVKDGNAKVANCDTNITDVVIPSTIENNGITYDVTSIGMFAFSNCTSLNNIEIGDNITSIGSCAFENTAYYKNANNWKNKVLYIDNYLIKARETIENYEIKEGTKVIADYAFSNCRDLTSVLIPNSVTNIGNSAFSNCRDLTSVLIPNSVTNIGIFAFSNCTNLISVLIPNSVTNIGGSAFSNCTSLNNIEIGDNITSIGSCAFENTAYYKNVNNWKNKVLYIDNYLIKARETIENYEIKEGTKVIADYAFSNCRDLTSVLIPNSVTNIGIFAFSNCTLLTIYCEAISEQSGWASTWNVSIRPIYWAGQWEYDAEGNPVPLS